MPDSNTLASSSRSASDGYGGGFAIRCNPAGDYAREKWGATLTGGCDDLSTKYGWATS
jgi:hypothetical protein